MCYWSDGTGLPGAVLSVPLLAIQKIGLSHANHPMATYALMVRSRNSSAQHKRCSVCVISYRIAQLTRALALLSVSIWRPHFVARLLHAITV